MRKRALPKLRVEQDWFAPVERNAYEAAWMRRAAAVAPQAVPALLGQDREAGVLVMAYLDPASHRLWKADLRAGHADPDVARAVGERLVRIHAATAHDPEVAAEFATDRIFYDIRLEPYPSRARAPTRSGRGRCKVWSRSRLAPGVPWCTAMSARRTS